MKGAPGGERGAAAFFRDVGLVARQELDDAVRTRRTAVVLVIYLAGAMLACNAFITALHKVEAQLSAALQLKASSSPGTVAQALWKSHQFRGMVTSLVGDEEAARDLLSVPPMALVYAWLAFLFTTPLILLSAAGRIAEEVGSGSARLALVRTTRLAWCLGKFGGQALLVCVALLLSAAGAWCVARFRMPALDAGATAAAMLVFAAKAWVYGLPMVGLALGVSQLTRSPGLATALALFGWIALGILSGMARHYAGEGWHRVWDVVQVLTPGAHRLAICRGDLAHVGPAVLFLVALALAYLLAGYARFTRRDL